MLLEHPQSLLTCTKVNSFQLRLFPTEGSEVMASRLRTPNPKMPQDRQRSERHTCIFDHELSTPACTCKKAAEPVTPPGGHCVYLQPCCLLPPSPCTLGPPAHLAVGGAQQLVVGRLAQLEADTVDNMQQCHQHAEQAQLLPHTQPAVQPAGEELVLGPPAELQGSCQLAWGHTRQQPISEQLQQRHLMQLAACSGSSALAKAGVR